MKYLGFPVSIGLHVLALLVAVFFSLSGVEPLAPAEESVPVEILTPEQFTALTKGEKTAKPDVKPVVKADKVAEAKPVEDNPAEAVKREAVATPPPPQPKTPDPAPEPPKPVVKAEPVPVPPKSDPPKKPEPATVDATPTPPKPTPPKPAPAKPVPKEDTQKLDELALKALQDDKPEQKPNPDKAKPEPPQPAKAAETPEKPAPSKAQPPQETTRTYDPSKVAALLSKDAPARTSRSDSETSDKAALGSARGTAPRLSLSQRSALVGMIMDHINPCWNKPAYAVDPSALAVLITVSLNPDGTLSADPEVLKYPAGAGGAAAAGAAMRAVKRCVTAQAPLKLPPNLYASWKEIEVNFDPST